MIFRRKFHIFLTFFFSIWVFFFTTIHESQDSRRRRKAFFLSPHYHFNPLPRHLDISRAITAESSPLDIGTSRTRARNLWFPSASQPLRYAPWIFLIFGNHSQNISVIQILIKCTIFFSPYFVRYFPSKIVFSIFDSDGNEPFEPNLFLL